MHCYLRVRNILAPQVGLEPTTNRLTADRSTTELLRKKKVKKIIPLKNKKRNLCR